MTGCAVVGVLDLSRCSNAEIRERYFDQLIIPVCAGQHGKHIDVIEEQCDPCFIDRICWRKRRKSRKTYRYPQMNPDMPLGFDIDSIPAGAVLFLQAMN